MNDTLNQLHRHASRQTVQISCVKLETTSWLQCQLLQPQLTSFSNLNFNKSKANRQNYMLINEV